MNIKDLEATVKKIDAAELASEFCKWLIDNVEQYIDNHKTKFILNISPIEVGDMPVSEQVENLYRQLDGEKVEVSISRGEELDWDSLDSETRSAVEDETAKLVILHELVERAYKIMVDDKVGMEKLFKALAYYYELVGFRDGIKIEKELDGCVNITAFHYEAISVPVEIKGKTPIFNDDGEVIGVEPCEATKTYMIPPSFAIDFDIEMFDKQVQTSLF